jgi:hypothetical protein
MTGHGLSIDADMEEKSPRWLQTLASNQSSLVFERCFEFGGAKTYFQPTLGVNRKT